MKDSSDGSTPEITSSTGKQQESSVSRWLEPILLAAILLLAGVLRMAAPGLTEFKADEARLLSLAYDMAQGELALRGISSSVGVPNFPASVWLYALPVSIWPHPYAATVFTGLLSTLTVALCYWLVRRYWGITAAFTATLLYAVSPWAIIFSRKIWAQNLLPLLVMGWAIGAALALVEKRPRYIWLHFVCLALAVQVHLAAIALVPATLLFLVIFRRSVRWRDLLIGAFLAALTVVPFALYLLRNQNPADLLAGAAGTEASGGLSLDSLRYTIMISLGMETHALTGGEAFQQYLALVPDLTIVHLLWGLLILAGLFYLAWAAWKRWPRPPAQVGLIVLIWSLMPALIFLWQWTPVFLHYFIAVLPAPYIAAGAVFCRLPDLLKRLWPGASSRAQRLAAGGGWLILIVAAVTQVGVLLTLQQFVYSTATPGGYGIPLAMKMDAVNRVETLMLETGAGELLIAGEGEAPLMDEFPAEWDVLLRDVPHRFVDVTQHALFPAEDVIVLLDSRIEPPQSTGDLYLEAAAAVTEIPLRPAEGSFSVLMLPGAARPAPEIIIEPPLLLANWVNLLGHDLPQHVDDETAVWQVHWRTGDNPDPADYQFFNHLVDSSGTRISQVDAAAFDPAQWRAGDTLIGRFLMPWPQTANGPMAMRVGMYRYPSLENVPLLDEAGNPYIDAAEFPLDS